MKKLPECYVDCGYHEYCFFCKLKDKCERYEGMDTTHGEERPKES